MKQQDMFNKKLDETLNKEEPVFEVEEVIDADVLLASGSAQRKKLLDALGIEYNIMPAGVDESSIVETDLHERAKKIAELKADWIAERYDNKIIISGDTFVELNGQILEKPESLAEAHRMWEGLSGNTVSVYTGYCYWDRELGLKVLETKTTNITFQEISHQEIERIVKEVPVLRLSGAFNVLFLECAVYTEKIEGSLTNIYGLPMEEIRLLLQRSGVI